MAADRQSFRYSEVMDQNPYQAPPEGESAVASSVEPWRKFTIGAAVFTVAAALGVVAMLFADYVLHVTEIPNHLTGFVFEIAVNSLCLVVPLGLLAWTFGSVFLLRARRRERSDSSSPP